MANQNTTQQNLPPTDNILDLPIDQEARAKAIKKRVRAAKDRKAKINQNEKEVKALEVIDKAVNTDPGCFRSIISEEGGLGGTAAKIEKLNEETAKLRLEGSG